LPLGNGNSSCEIRQIQPPPFKLDRLASGVGSGNNTAAPVSFSFGGLKTEIVGLVTFEIRMIGFLPVDFTAFSSPISPFSPGALSGQTSIVFVGPGVGNNNQDNQQRQQTTAE